MAAMVTRQPEASIGLLKRVPGGQQRLGSPFHPREIALRRTVNVREFEMAQSPVTVNQYAAFVASGGRSEKRWWGDMGWEWLIGEEQGWGREDRSRPDRWEAQRDRPHHPVVGVTFYEAAAYCAWLSEQKKKTIRLPTEDEWERAARGEDGRPFPWGEAFDPALANTFESERNDTVPAASIGGDVGPYGLRDMAGNVQQWMSTHYQPLPEEAYPAGPLHVARGGSYDDTAYGARTTYRRAYPPGYFFPFLGFRLVVEIR